MEKTLGQGWLLGETVITGIGQGYIQTTPIQLCLMIAQIGNGGHNYPKIVVNEKDHSSTDKFMPLFVNSKNIKIVQDAMSSTNEARGTSYKSRIDDKNTNLLAKLEQRKKKILKKTC